MSEFFTVDGLPMHTEHGGQRRAACGLDFATIAGPHLKREGEPADDAAFCKTSKEARKLLRAGVEAYVRDRVARTFYDGKLERPCIYWRMAPEVQRITASPAEGFPVSPHAGKYIAVARLVVGEALSE